MRQVLRNSTKMQANYPKKQDRRNWDDVHVIYPVRKFPTTGESSETVGRFWRGPPEVLRRLREPVDEIRDYLRDYNITKGLTKSQTIEDYGFKLSGTTRYNKHTSCLENEYINTPCRRPPEPSWHKELEPLDTTHDGFEKHLDPYLTTSRLHHRPFTADQLQKLSNTKDVVTYYTYADVPWAWGPKPKVGEWRLPPSRPKSMYDREKFKYEFSEVRTRNKLNWVPGTFRTEARDNYVQQTARPEAQIHNFEEEVRSHYQRSLAGLQTNVQQEHSTVRGRYQSESTQIGSQKPICAVVDQFKENNKRLEAIYSRYRNSNTSLGT